MTALLTSAAGIISLLEEPQNDVKLFALKKLNTIVNEFWPEIADSIDKIEVLHEDKSYPEEQRQLAALVASKVYYHLGIFEDSLSFALGAGPLFDLSQRSEYIETTLAKCVDHYVQARLAETTVDPRLETIVDRMFEQCYQDRQYKQALGIALETRRMDMFGRSICLSDNTNDMLAYAFRVAMQIGQRGFRDTVLRNLVGLYLGLPNPDYINMCQCLIFLDDSGEASKLLDKLSKTEDDRLMSYQIALDLYESGTQYFLSRVLSSVKLLAEGCVKEEEDNTMEKHWEQLIQILSGEISIALQLQFLVRSNKSDLTILKQTKDAVRVSICHTGTVIANAFMHSGTTSDQFLRENLDWLARATNWAKLTATASLGVIHRGHEKESLSLMQSYLPRDGGPTAGYSEGGALYALGLIHANHGAAIIDYLMQQLKDAPNEMIRHGGSIGLGLAAMGTGRRDIYDMLKSNLYLDDAVTGEAAGISMGLVMLGTMDENAIKDMIGYAQETQHEKILRGLALGISFLMFGRLETADTVIARLLGDKDSLLRRAGVLSVAMAYCGTASNSAIQKLLKVAVSDVNDDVRRASVIGLGFLLFRSPEQCPSVVSLLAESYNPHVRYGAALAIGIACAGSGNKDALSLLEPLLQDPVNYVRQGSLLASAFLLIQQTEAICPKVKEFRALYSKVLNDKHDDVMAKFGAILAQGIIDGGGRNVTINLASRTGHVWVQGAVGMMLFTHYWYWFPMALCLGISFSPTFIVGINREMQMPILQFKSNIKPSTFAYPAPLEERKKEEKERVTTAILSVTAKAKRREADKVKATGVKLEEVPMEVDEVVPPPEEVVKKVEEPNFELIGNPARVMRQQLRYIELTDKRWKSLKDVNTGGILVVKDTSPGQDFDLVQPVAACGPQKDDEEDEPLPPEPFEYTEAED